MFKFRSLRWIIAAVAVAAMIIYALMPSQKTARAIVSVDRFRSALGDRLETLEDHAFRVRSVAEVFKLESVAQQACLGRKVALPNRKDPVAWLSKNIKVEPRGDSLLVISIPAALPKDQKTIVRAVADACVLLLSHQESHRAELRIRQLEELRKDYLVSLKSLRGVLAHIKPESVEASGIQTQIQRSESRLDRVESALEDLKLDLKSRPSVTIVDVEG